MFVIVILWYLIFVYFVMINVVDFIMGGSKLLLVEVVILIFLDNDFLYFKCCIIGIVIDFVVIMFDVGLFDIVL